MSDPPRETNRAGRRSKRFLRPAQKYEIFLRVVCQELTITEATEQWQADRGMIMRICTVAKDKALEALAISRLGARQPSGTTSSKLRWRLSCTVGER